MADIEFGEAVGSENAPRPLDISTIINGFGAVVSMALVAGLGWWGYQLLIRDVTGVPVVRALEGPMRIAPEDPGGANAEFQGLAVNNIPAVGEAEAPADRLVLAPKPTVLTPEDQPAEVLAAITSTETEAQAAPATVPKDQNAPASPDAQVAVSQGGAVVSEDVPTDQAAIIEATLKSLTGEEGAAEPAAQQVVAIATIPRDVPGVASSLFPVVRPQTLEPMPRPATVNAVPSEADGDTVAWIDPADIPAGTRLVQLGAFDSPEVAKAEWLNVASRFDDFMTGKSRVIEKAQAGGKVFYRLRAHGFDDLSDARRFCSALLAGQANCIPVVSR